MPKELSADESNYTLGRGKLYWNDRPIGCTKSIMLQPKFGMLHVAFTTDAITDENHALWFSAIKDRVKGSLRYEADNPKGKNFGYEFPTVGLKATERELKGGEWQQLAFTATVYEQLVVLEEVTVIQRKTIWLDAVP